MSRAKYRVCPTCNGEGTIVNPALTVWTPEDAHEDPEGFAAALRGDYDVPCPECGGRRVVTQEDEQHYAEREADRRTQLMEDGIFPGHPDFF